jgi:hypothetical protein
VCPVFLSENREGQLNRSILPLIRRRTTELRFPERLRAFHESWCEQREMGELLRRHDRHSQYRAASMIYRWLLDTGDDVREAYDGELAVQLSPMAAAEAVSACITLSIARGYEVVLRLDAKQGPRTRRWYLAVATRAGENAPERRKGPDRSHGSWTRARIEELALEVLVAYERDRCERVLAVTDPGPTADGGPAPALAAAQRPPSQVIESQEIESQLMLSQVIESQLMLS